MFCALNLLLTNLLVRETIARTCHLVLLALVNTVVVSTMGLLRISLGLLSHSNLISRRQV